MTARPAHRIDRDSSFEHDRRAHEANAYPERLRIPRHRKQGKVDLPATRTLAVHVAPHPTSDISTLAVRMRALADVFEQQQSQPRVVNL